MLEEFLNAFTELAQKAGSLDEVATDNRRQKTFLSPDGTVVDVRKLPAPRSHRARTIRDAVHAAMSLSSTEDRDVLVSGDSYWIFYNMNDVVGVIDIDDRLDTVGMPLIASDRWRALLKWNESSDRRPHDVPHRLRKRLIRELGLDGLADVLDSLSKLVVKSDGSVDVQASHGQTAVRESVRKHVDDAAKPPESVKIPVRLFENRDVAFSEACECYILIDEDQAKIEMGPMPGEIERINRACLEYIREQIIHAGASAERITEGNR